jgi:hypothetical protein
MVLVTFLPEADGAVGLRWSREVSVATVDRLEEGVGLPSDVTSWAP